MSHNPFNPEKCTALEPTADQLKEVRKDLEQLNGRLDSVKNDVEELQTHLYVEHDNEEEIQKQLERARLLVSKLATRIGLDWL